ncbi:MAG TPA: DUF6387 family protein [Herbaspirillum sp.]|uniref:DUF6387 family protein n=1 Tax=Herbaspirillum sp. TaxID=1890675 RepID=UPI002D6ED8FF|nr:DUF6387 family protein [Herbaspirillum sp.]HZG22374.1 DUF6387 family protein [Herbaspirillum sp.]
MPRSSKPSPSCPSWFHLERYSRTKSLDFDGWKTQIGNRIYLEGLIASEQYELFDLHFAEISAGPFHDIGFDANYAAPSSVYPLTIAKTVTILEALIGNMEKDEVDRHTQCDEKLTDIGADGFSMQRHVTIDLRASESKIRRDFEKYLTAEIQANRQRFERKREAEITETVLASWSRQRILPYQDLILWFRRRGEKRPSDQVLSTWLYPDGAGTKDKVREIGDAANFAFTMTTLRQLALAAES